VLVDEVLAKWGVAGLDKHVQKVREFYKQRRDLMLLAAQKHLKGPILAFSFFFLANNLKCLTPPLLGLAEWNTPQGGMFLWIKCLRVKDTYSMLMERGLEQKIMLLPGREFMEKRDEPCPYVRASYSVLPLEHIDEVSEYEYSRENMSYLFLSQSYQNVSQMSSNPVEDLQYV
jgi:DNA-binding transcriptional MocR family regulator